MSPPFRPRALRRRVHVPWKTLLSLGLLGACSSPGPVPLAAAQPASRASTAVAPPAASAVVTPVPPSSAPASSVGALAASSPLPDAGMPPAEHWTDELRSVESCRDYRVDYAVAVYADPHGPKRQYGYDGYGLRQVEITREIDGAMRRHCVSVLHPRGGKSASGRPIRVAEYIDAAWYRLIERTLSRIPWLHLQQVQVIVLDNRPILHGVASFSRNSPGTDARDGRTIWLHEHLFTGMNHWAHGNYGYYWAYHVQRDAVAVDGQPADHELFSPVLLHEIGHLVNYNVVNGAPSDPACPPCAQMCGDLKTCDKLDAAGKEAFCATAYCTGFGYDSGTENWAEMYRWYYQAGATRDLLAKTFPACFAVLDGGEGSSGLNAGLPAPWTLGLGETDGYRRTRWASCSDKPCRER